MKTKEQKFKDDLIEVFKNHGCTFDKARAYYAGEPETLSVRVKGTLCDIPIEEIIEESGLPFTQ
jgi:hypothetical protein